MPDSPGHLCGKIKVGDRLLTLNGKDVRNATEPEVIDLIKQAGNRIDLEIQSYSQVISIVLLLVYSFCFYFSFQRTK